MMVAEKVGVMLQMTYFVKLVQYTNSGGTRTRHINKLFSSQSNLTTRVDDCGSVYNIRK